MATRELTVPEKILIEASRFIGLQEIKGSEDNPIIMSMFQDIGHSWVKHDETAWCSCFINYVAKQCKLSRSGKLNARSWLDVGEDIKTPRNGDIVVFWRESVNSWKGHVGQGNEVCISIYDKKRLLGFRRLLKE
jgi:uncharacterized protein (TIGR02594 family)